MLLVFCLWEHCWRRKERSWFITSPENNDKTQAITHFWSICFILDLLQKVYLEILKAKLNEEAFHWVQYLFCSIMFSFLCLLKLFHEPVPPSAAPCQSPVMGDGLAVISRLGLWSSLSVMLATPSRDPTALNAWRCPELLPSGTLPCLLVLVCICQGQD